MRVLTAAEAINPAIQRTRLLLFGHRRWGTFFKIAFVAWLAAIGNGGANFHSNSFGNHGSGHPMPQHMAAFLAALAAFVVLIVLVALAIWLVLFYIGNRMQFVLFDMVLTLRTEVGPTWRKYGDRTWRWIGMKIVLIVATLLIVAIIALPVILKGIQTYHHHAEGVPVGLIGMAIGSFAVLFLVLLVFSIAANLLHDFVLPAVALEDARILPTIGRLLTLCKAEPGQIALYLLLRVAFAIVFGIAAIIITVIVALIAGLILGLFGLIFFAALHHHGVAATVLMFVVLGVLGLIFLACVLAVSIALSGVFITFQQAWALYFLGGRYTLLGDLLEPPVAYAPPPLVPPAASTAPPFGTLSES